MKKDLAEESKTIANLFRQKDEIFQKVKFYENTLLNLEKLFEAIQERIKKGGIIQTYKIFGFIPIVKKIKLDKTDIARLNIELFEIEDEVWQKKQYFEMWLKRKKEYEVKFDEITRECNQAYDALLKEATDVVAPENPRLALTLRDYKNPDNDQKLKNEFYLYMKQEVNNYYNYGKGKRKRPTFSKTEKK